MDYYYYLPKQNFLDLVKILKTYGQLHMQFWVGTFTLPLCVNFWGEIFFHLMDKSSIYTSIYVFLGQISDSL